MKTQDLSSNYQEAHVEVSSPQALWVVCSEHEEDGRRGSWSLNSKGLNRLQVVKAVIEALESGNLLHLHVVKPSLVKDMDTDLPAGVMEELIKFL
jgi:hypothetical protein